MEVPPQTESFHSESFFSIQGLFTDFKSIITWSNDNCTKEITVYSLQKLLF